MSFSKFTEGYSKPLDMVGSGGRTTGHGALHNHEAPSG